MTRRPGMTMPEVLVAIFVVAIGLVSVMAMFPFGAKQMSDALISDRSASHAVATDGLVRSYWREKVAENNGNGEPFWDALDNPDTGAYVHSATGTPSTPRLPKPGANEPSYPVFLDSMGEVGRGSTNKYWVGDGTRTTPSFVPRRNMRLVLESPNPASLALRLWSQADGFSWDDDSVPKPGVDMRELRYNSLAVIQRPTNRDRFGATLKVVVFINRRHQFYPTGSEVVFPNATFPSLLRFTPGSTQLSLPVMAATDIRKGSWIMDGTVNPPAAPSIRHANFYRVVSAIEDGAGRVDIELHTAIKRIDGQTTAYDGTAVVLAGVAEVFERPVLTGNHNP